MRAISMGALLALVGAASWSKPAQACSDASPSTVDEAITFAGRTVPLNATLTIINPYPGSFDEGVVLVDPDGVEVAAMLQPNGDDVHVDVVPARALSPGRWRFRNPAIVSVVGDVDFTVVDATDDTAPAAATIKDSTIGGLSTCTGIQLLTVEVEDDDIAWVRVDDGGVAMDSAGAVTFSPPADEVTVTAVDFAGNESSATVGGLGGCAAVPAATPAALLGLTLLLLRRRRR